ncbi:MAG: hypothetical protein AB1765_12870 [Candidatus Hydrogenedentota bacterium]
MKKLLYQVIFWLAKHSPDVLAIPIGRWLQKRLNQERRKAVLNELADLLLKKKRIRKEVKNND